ncbi:MAG: fatty acid desaturase [Oligoflexia bacterium]|nr:fatty acid desaturase [Oligoflexia bacterium]
MTQKETTWTIQALKREVNDLFQPIPWIYWTDFLASVLIGYTSFFLAALRPFHPVTTGLCFILSSIAIYRAALFIHELTHQTRESIPGFSTAWNLLIGIPFMIPSFMYRGVHIDHHRKNLYGTIEDGEYLPLGAQSFSKSLAYIFQSLYLPLLLVLRFSLIGPLSIFHKRTRLLVMQKASSFAIHPNATRAIPRGRDLRNWIILEVLCFAYLWAIITGLILGWIPWALVPNFYALMVFMFIINSLRTVVAHRYQNGSLQELSFEDQLLDSINLEGNKVFEEAIAPVGLRYHGLHHLFPTIPYHSLGTAHRQLKSVLPANHFYHQMSEPSFWVAFKKLYKQSRIPNTKEETSQAEA